MTPFLNRDNRCAVIVTQYWNWRVYFPQAKVEGPSLDGSKRHWKVIGKCNSAAIRDAHSEAYLKNPRNVFAIVKSLEKSGHNCAQEYFNYMMWFVSYLRAEALAFAIKQPVAAESNQPLPTFQKVKHSDEGGLRLRYFRRGELNRVVPFQYRRNVRCVNLSSGMSRMLEWYIPSDS